MITLSVRSNLKAVTKALTDLERTQLPYATALALTGIAKRVQSAETAAIAAVFDRPNAFTQRAVGMTRATKATLTATVFVKDAQAKYLEPQEAGGPQFLGGGKRIRTPVDIKLNASGNIAAGQIKRLLARPDVFIGTVKGVSGLWQRPVRGKRRRVSRRKLLNHGGLYGADGGSGTKGALNSDAGFLTGLTLLVAFTRPAVVTARFHYHERAAAIVAATFATEFGAAMTKALATIRL